MAFVSEDTASRGRLEKVRMRFGLKDENDDIKSEQDEADNIARQLKLMLRLRRKVHDARHQQRRGGDQQDRRIGA